MDDDAMLQRLAGHHQAIMAGLSRIRTHCDRPYLGGETLEADRSALTAASLARSKFVSEEIVPALLVNADDGLRTRLSELVYLTAAKRTLSNGHIAAWTSATIEDDWKGYCAAARTIWAMMEDQIASERRVLFPALGAR